MRSDLETRDAVKAQASGAIIKGYAAVFNSPTVIAGEFVEQIAPGAFAETLRRGDVVALLDHDSGRVLGRQSAGTLRLQENGVGLLFELDADPTTPEGQTAIGTVRRRDIKGCSFGFRVREENWTNEGSLPLRTILEIELNEITLTAFPAYETTAAWVVQRDANRSAAMRRLREKAEREQRLRGIR